MSKGTNNSNKEITLQAVVLADDFTKCVQSVCPSMMLPVANIRLLDYLVETLMQSQVQEVFLYGSNHVEALRDYVKKMCQKRIIVTLITSDGCRTLGDALRDMDTKGCIRSDFILVRGDAFTNANLKDLMSIHRTRRQRDKGTALTLLLRDVGTAERESCVFIAEKSSKKVLFHKKLTKEDKKVQLELEWFLNHDQVDVHSSYVDTHIYLCSASVLPLFADNFDFQTMEDFIRGVLMNEEILDSRIYWQPLDREKYAYPVTSWQAYDNLSRDVLQRNAYPLTPDTLPPLRNIIYLSRSTYKHRASALARGCTLQRDTMVGEDSVLGENTLVTRSVVGGGCSIGNRVRIDNSHLLSNVTIEDDCVVEGCVLFDGCVVKKSSRLEGCLLLPSTELPGNSRYVDSVLRTEDGKTVKAHESKDELFCYRLKGDNDVEDNNSESEETSSERSSSRAGAGSPLPDDTNMFLSEVIDSLLRGYQDRLNCDNLILEINSSRYAYNVGIREVTYNVIKAILLLPTHHLTEQKVVVDQSNYQKILKLMMSYFNPIIGKYVKTEDAQEDCLRAIEDVVLTNLEFLPLVQLVIHTLYNRDILSEEKILEWYEDAPEDEDEDNTDGKKIRAAVEPFIAWLREAEEDSSEE